jgi:hypothetical protein
VKPVNLNQLLFHEKSDRLSFYFPPLGNAQDLTPLEAFIDDMISQLVIQGKSSLMKLIERNRGHMRRIVKSHPDKSHGFFVAEDLVGYIIIQNVLNPFCIIAQIFHVRPLLEELFINPEFFLVNISLYDIKIYRCDFQHLEIIQQYEFDHLPEGLKINRERFFTPDYLGLIPYKTILALKTIALKLKDMILYESLPVVLTGLEQMKTPFLRYLNDTTGIISHLDADFYEKNCMEILARVGDFRYVIMDYYSAQLKERLKRLMKSRRILSELDDIIRFIRANKVTHLVIPSQQTIWGKIDFSTGEFTVHKKIGKTSVDILNELAEEVIKQGGKIQILDPHFFPNNTRVLAILKGQHDLL